MGFRNPLTHLSQLIADTITGALIQTAATGNRMMLTAVGGFGELRLYTGHVSETLYGYLRASTVGTGATEAAELEISTGMMSSQSPARIVMTSEPETGGQAPSLAVEGLFIPDTVNGARFGAEGVANVRGIDFGSYSDTTNASGEIGIPHDIGAAPVAVMISEGTSGTNFRARVVALGASTITVSFRQTSTLENAPAGTSVSGRWFAIR